MTMAKGLTSSYLPLGAVAMRHDIAEKFETQMFYGGLTYSSHPVSLAASLATIGVYEEDGLIEQRRPARPGHARAPRAARGEAPERRRAPQPRACSGSSTSSGAATRGRRSRRSTARRTR